MNSPRENIYAALFSLLAALPGLGNDGNGNITASRRALLFNQVPPALTPALFMEQTGETQQEMKLGFPKKWKLQVIVGLYVNTGPDPTLVPATTMNALLDALEALLTPTPGSRQTLGGLVQDVRISGEEKIALGSLGPQAFAYVPIEVITV